MSTTSLPTQIPTGTWNIDPSHSRVGFSVKHLGIATVRGTFDQFQGALVVDGDLAQATIGATIEAASINTRENDRDAHLRSADFFDAEVFPQITFASTAVRIVDEDTFVVTGDLTMHGVTLPVDLTATIEGFETDPWGNERVGLELAGSLSRGDYGMKFNQALGGGNVLVSDKVKISLDISAVRPTSRKKGRPMEPTLIDHAAAPGAPGPTAPVDRILHGAIHLDVIEPARSLGFWRDVVGLTELSRTADAIHLGAGARTLVVLHPGAVRAAGHGHAGLYHVALHVPDAAEFARVIARLATARVPQAPTDHIFSMATYLTDPDGIGLEITLETPERFGSFDIGPRGIALVDSDGRLRGPTERLDLDPVLAHLDGTPLADPLADGTIVGHVHLHVPDVAAALRFYRDVIGFDVHMDMPAIGMADLSAGGRFPHRFALNSWAGPAAAQPPAGTAGMRFATLVVPDDTALDAVHERLRAGLLSADGRDGAIETTDPAGNRLRIVTAAAL